MAGEWFSGVKNLEIDMKFIYSTLLLALLATGVHAADRLPTIAPENYTPEQKKAADDFMAARKGPVFGPFEPLMHSPQVMTLARSTGDYLRFNSALGNMLSELVILVTAREWSQDFEWNFHYPIALKAGIKASEDEEIVYDFSTELHKNKRVSDATFARADKRFGKKGVVDLTGINAYYTLLAMQLNVAQYVAPDYATKMPRFPE